VVDNEEGEEDGDEIITAKDLANVSAIMNEAHIFTYSGNFVKPVP
jgi:hypothetical protein